MWLFALPALLINAFHHPGPAVLTFTAAFLLWDGVGTPVWAGLTNFRNLFDDPVFWSALTKYFIWTMIFLTVPVCIALVMAAALLMIPNARSSFSQSFSCRASLRSRSPGASSRA